MKRLATLLACWAVSGVAVSACRGKASTRASRGDTSDTSPAQVAGPLPPPSSSPSPSLTQVEVHAGAGLPMVCDQYRRNLLRCMASNHFPPAAKEGQRLALEQMLAIVRQEQRQTDQPGGASAAIENCRDSLSTLQESSKITCPDAF